MDKSIAPAEAIGTGPSLAPATLGATRRVCLFSIGDTDLVMSLHYVREVFIISSITNVPGCSTALSGVTQLRGVVMPLADLRPLIGVSQKGPMPKYSIVVHAEERQFGILTERVPEIMTVREDDFIAAPGQEGRTANSLFPTALKIEERYYNVVEPIAILTAVER